MKASDFKFVNYLWDDAVASKLSPVERLVYRSNILGTDQRITNTGGGNTSSKVMEIDPLTGEKVEVLWVKGSGEILELRKSKIFHLSIKKNCSDYKRSMPLPLLKDRRLRLKTIWSECMRNVPLI